MKLTNVTTEHPETGEKGNVPRADYIKGTVKQYEVKPFESEGGSATAEKVVEHILKASEEGKDVSDEIASAYPELVNTIQEDYARTVKAKEGAAAEAAAAKEKKAEEKKAEAEKKEKEKLALELTRKEFVAAANAGAELAASELKTDLESLRASLPEGVTVVQKGNGFGLDFGKDATKETIGQTLGYLEQRAANNSVLSTQIQFWIGDTITVAVERGIFPTAKDAGIYLAAAVKESTGKEYVPASLDQYTRMAARTPIELRNPEADFSAYLEVSKMKIPRKGDKEKDEDFKKRLKSFESDREALQKQIAEGQIKKRKDVLKPVEELLIKHGLKEKPSEEPKISITQQALIFFHASLALESLVGVHKPDVAIYGHKDKKVELSKTELESLRDTAQGHLLNAFYTNTKAGLTSKDYIAGHITKSVPTEIGKSADGKPLMEDVNTNVDVFPPAFFEVPEEEAPPAEETKQEAAPAESAE